MYTLLLYVFAVCVFRSSLLTRTHRCLSQLFSAFNVGNEMNFYMLQTLKMHLNTLIHSGNSCHLLGLKLFSFSVIVSFCYSLGLLFPTLSLFKYTVYTKRWVNWRECWKHCDENCLLVGRRCRSIQFYISKWTCLHATVNKVGISDECTFMAVCTLFESVKLQSYNFV